MSKQIYVNLPVADLSASIAFFTRLGFPFNPEFSDDTASCMVVSEHIFVMLLTHAKFSSFTPRPISDAQAQTEVLLALTCESREAVDAMVRDAVAGGGSTYNSPQDHGFMYAHGFSDLDGHIWEIFHMSPVATPQEARP